MDPQQKKTKNKKRMAGAATSRPILVLTSVRTPALGQYVTDPLQSNRIPRKSPRRTGREQRGEAHVLFGFFQLLGSTQELWPQSSQYIQSTQHRVKGGPGTSLAVLWLRLCASITGGGGSISGHGTKIPHAA